MTPELDQWATSSKEANAMELGTEQSLAPVEEQGGQSSDALASCRGDVAGAELDVAGVELDVAGLELDACPAGLSCVYGSIGNITGFADDQSDFDMQPDSAIMAELCQLIDRYPEVYMNDIFSQLNAEEIEPAKQMENLALEVNDLEVSSALSSIPDWLGDVIDDIIKEEELAAANKLKPPPIEYRRVRTKLSIVAALQLNIERKMKAKLEEAWALLANKKMYNCEYCFRDLPNARDYVDHLKYHRELELVHGYSRCNLCSTQFFNVIELKTHWVVAHPTVFRH